MHVFSLVRNSPPRALLIVASIDGLSRRGDLTKSPRLLVVTFVVEWCHLDHHSSSDTLWSARHVWERPE